MDYFTWIETSCYMWLKSAQCFEMVTDLMVKKQIVSITIELENSSQEILDACLTGAGVVLLNIGL